MADVAAAAFGRRVSTTDYVSLVGRTSIPGPGPVPVPSPGVAETQPLVAKDMRATGVLPELQTLLALALPVIGTFTLELMPPIVQVVFLGRLGSSEIAAGALATTYANVAGLSIGLGLATAMDTLCSQAYGASQPRAVGLWLQRAALLLSAAFVPIAAMLWCSGNVLVALGQPPQLSWRAQEFVRLTVPAIYLLWMFEVMKQALQAQGIIRFNLAAALAMNITNAALCWALTRDPARAFEGIAVARTIATGVLVAALAALIRWRGLYDAVWPAEGWSWRALQRWGRFLRFALPGCLMTCIDWWAFEVLTLVTGFLPNPETAMAANMILFQITSVTFSVFLGLSVAVTIHVGNLLGAGAPARARTTVRIAAATAISLGGIACVFLYVLRAPLARAFTTDAGVQAATAEVLPLLAVFNQCDAVVTLCFGVFRGAGMQAHGAALNLFTQYVVALPLAWLLGLHWQGGVAGLWLGPTIAKATAAVLGAIIVTRMDWDELSRLAVARASEEHHQ